MNFPRCHFDSPYLIRSREEREKEDSGRARRDPYIVNIRQNGGATVMSKKFAYLVVGGALVALLQCARRL